MEILSEITLQESASFEINHWWFEHVECYFHIFFLRIVQKFSLMLLKFFAALLNDFHVHFSFDWKLVWRNVWFCPARLSSSTRARGISVAKRWQFEAKNDRKSNFSIRLISSTNASIYTKQCFLIGFYFWKFRVNLK